MGLFRAETATMFVQNKIKKDIANLEKVCKAGNYFFSHTFKDGNPDREPADSDIEDKGEIFEAGFGIASRADGRNVYVLELYDPRWARDFYVYFYSDKSADQFEEWIRAEFDSTP